MRTKIWPSFLLILIAIPAWATPAATVTLSRPLAMGEAYRAAGAANGAIYLNPAGMSRLNMYATELSYMRGELGGDDDTLHLSIVDTKTQPVGVGVGYSFKLRLRPKGVEATVLNVSLETDGVPGAMFVRFLGDTVDPDAFRREELVASSAASLALPDGDDPVDLSVLPVRVRSGPGSRYVDVVFQYRPLDPEEASRIARFWMQCQARARG